MLVKLLDSRLSGVILTTTGHPAAIDSKAVCPEAKGKESTYTSIIWAYNAVLTQPANLQRFKIPSFPNLDDISG